MGIECVQSLRKFWGTRRRYCAGPEVIAQQGKLVNWHLRAGITITQCFPRRCFPLDFPPSLFDPRFSGPKNSCLFIAGSRVQLAFSKFVQNYCQWESWSWPREFSNGQNTMQNNTWLPSCHSPISPTSPTSAR